ncbi:asparagine synthase-related protein [Mycobacterium camsae]|uniref:asparagine synthase-related protein n=1 Tax=Mycobacterium gordonae TaxID=1778 RepID=UPI001F119D7A|nr:asparagine synthase-related protein [Mycobacterium gordonae]
MRADTRSEAEIVVEFRATLRDAVRHRLVADVEVASYLSGGIAPAPSPAWPSRR